MIDQDFIPLYFYFFLGKPLNFSLSVKQNYEDITHNVLVNTVHMLKNITHNKYLVNFS